MFERSVSPGRIQFASLSGSSQASNSSGGGAATLRRMVRDGAWEVAFMAFSSCASFLLPRFVTHGDASFPAAPNSDSPSAISDG